MNYTEACIDFAGFISVSLCLGSIASFDEMPQRWRVVGKTVFRFTDQRFDSQTSRFRDDCITGRPTGW